MEKQEKKTSKRGTYLESKWLPASKSHQGKKKMRQISLDNYLVFKTSEKRSADRSAAAAVEITEETPIGSKFYSVAETTMLTETSPETSSPSTQEIIEKVESNSDYDPDFEFLKKYSKNVESSTPVKHKRLPDQSTNQPIEKKEKSIIGLSINQPIEKKEVSLIDLNKTIELTDDESIDDDIEPEKQGPKPLTLEDSIFNASFDMLKRPEKPKYEAKPKTKAERMKLPGRECPCCEKYYDALNLSPESRAKRVNNSSRHRTNAVRSKTPEYFWETGFPSTQELIARGHYQRHF